MKARRKSMAKKVKGLKKSKKLEATKSKTLMRKW